MATGKLLTGNISASQGIKGYFTCCFNSHSRKSSADSAHNKSTDTVESPADPDNSHWHDKQSKDTDQKHKKDKKDKNGGNDF